MIYRNFDKHITRKHGIVVEGWPLRTFDNPSSIGSQVELKVLLNAWQTGVTRFWKMTVEDHMAWVENHSKSKPSSALPTLPSSAPLPSSSPRPHDGHDLITATTPPVLHTPLNIVHFGPSDTPPINTNLAGGTPKKPRKTRSDKGKPRKKALQVPGVHIFHTNML